MNDEQMQPLLEVWLRDRDAAPRDVNGGIARVVARVPQTRQRGRWWPLPVFGRKAQTPTATDTAEYQPMPMPTTNGHAPTVIGRTQTMFSPVKAITAGALVFAIGGALLIAQPFDQQGGSLPGAATDADAVRVTTTVDCDFSTSTCSYTASDPRVEGTGSNGLSGFVKVGINSVVSWTDATIEGPEGDWTGHQYIFEDGTGEVDVDMMLVGEGAYEGLAYIASDIDSEVASGVIYQGDLPPVGPLPSTADE